MRVLPILLLLVTVTSAAEGAAPSTRRFTWPDTPAGGRLRSLVDAYNSGDSARLVAFVRECYPPAIRSRSAAVERVAAHWRSVWREFGPAAPFALLSSDSTGAEAWVRGEVTEAWFTLQVGISRDPSHDIMSAGVGRGISPPSAGPVAALPPGRIASELAAYMARLERAGLFSGAVLVARGDQVLHRAAAGYASREHGVRNTPGTRFNVGSVGKMLTAAAALRLVAAGRVGLDDSLSRFFAEYPRPFADRVTLRHLLTHSSGIELDDDSLYNREAETARSLSGIVAAQVRGLARHPELLTQVPGREYNYTNEGFDLAGAIVERVCGRGFAACLDSLVFAPAGMRNTGLFAVDEAVPALATGYTSSDGARPGKLPGPPRTNHLWLSAYGRPSGQMYSTVDDLWRFARALRGDQWLPAAQAAAMTGAQIKVRDDVGSREEYGFGVERARKAGSWRVGHSGGLAGASARLDIYPELDYTVIVLANQDWIANNVADRIGEWLGAGFSTAPEHAHRPPTAR